MIHKLTFSMYRLPFFATVKTYVNRFIEDYVMQLKMKNSKLQISIIHYRQLKISMKTND